uniref:Uncharacterized protein n=1 Tax=Sphaerodactylus townsendi TaxID=933632 RepID=A0ACB8EGX0_9SAUR
MDEMELDDNPQFSSLHGMLCLSLAKYTPLTYNKLWSSVIPRVGCGSLIERVKAVAAPREVHQWPRESESAVPFYPSAVANGGLIKPTHIIVETMM